MTSFQTSILFIIFNRLDTASRVFQTIKEVKPKRLYFFSDAPRLHIQGEKEQCENVRALINQVDWPCEVKTFFLEENLGPRLALGKGISWFFEHEEEGIILEHDCLPSQSFYSFCETLLAHYRTDERIMHISGDNFQFGIQRGEASYYFSHYNHIWGFATWRRAWKYYDVQMKLYPEFKKKGYIKTIFRDNRIARFWTRLLDEAYLGKIQTWDYQWAFSMWCQNSLAILPNQNLVSNIGFDSFALNTTKPDHILANMTRYEIKDISHPDIIIPDDKADNYSIDYIFYPTMINLAKNKLKKWGLKA